MQLANGSSRRFVGFANIHSYSAPGLKLAALRVQGKVWWISWDYVQLGFARALAFGKMRGQAFQQSCCVRMLRRGEHSRCWTYFGDATGVEDEHAISELREQSRVVSDEEHRKTEFLPKLPEEL